VCTGGREFFSQYGEDRILAQIFSGVPCGTCAEVGAFDGVTFSNTFYFERLGWKCILVEPNPELCEKIRQKRSAIVFQCAASDRPGRVVLRVDPSTGAEYASIAPPGTDQSRQGSRPRKVREFLVPTRTLDEVFEQVGVDRIDFISIDVEGQELQALRGFSLDRWRPRILLVEDNSYYADPSVPTFLAARGYVRFLRTGCNDWYAHRADRALATPGRRAKVRVVGRLWRLGRRLPSNLRTALRPLRALLMNWARR